MSTFIERTSSTRPGLRLALKDLIDQRGLPTTAGCRAVAETAQPAEADAACLAGARRAEATGCLSFVGKVNLHELANGGSGINPWFGTPINPVDPRRIPGGSSSGSAVVVAMDDADVALGTDTGGSVRIPAACCGVAGLKTTVGRISTGGVRPLAPRFDTVGPLARDVAGLITGMALLEPGFSPAAGPASAVGRLRLPLVDPAVEKRLDLALRAAELKVRECPLPEWGAANTAAMTVLSHEAFLTNGHFLRENPTSLGDDVREFLTRAGMLPPETVAAAASKCGAFESAIQRLLKKFELLVCPVLTTTPPLLEHAELINSIVCTLPFSVAGLPAVALPVGGHGFSVSMQIIGPPNSEDLLLTTARRVESAVATEASR